MGSHPMDRGVYQERPFPVFFSFWRFLWRSKSWNKFARQPGLIYREISRDPNWSTYLHTASMQCGIRMGRAGLVEEPPVEAEETIPTGRQSCFVLSPDRHSRCPVFPGQHMAGLASRTRPGSRASRIKWAQGLASQNARPSRNPGG